MGEFKLITQEKPRSFEELEFKINEIVKTGIMLPDGRFTDNYFKKIFYYNVSEWRYKRPVIIEEPEIPIKKKRKYTKKTT